MGNKPAAGTTAGGKEIAFNKRNFGTNGMEVHQGNVVAPMKQQLMALPNGEDSNVICKGAWDAACSRDSPRPRAKKKAYECHTEGAPLWNPTNVPMKFH